MSALPDPAAAETTRRNLAVLVQLRWLAVAGQLATILVVRFGLGEPLPLAPLFVVLALLALVNLVATATRPWWPASDAALLATLLVDVAGLTVQLYLTGGAANPFVSLYLLQVVLGAVLLRPPASWLVVVVTSLAFAVLAVSDTPLALSPAVRSTLSGPYLFASWLGYVLAATLLVTFVARITRNLRDRDARLADLGRRAAEEEQVVRMGLLASGAAHELGTPLASLAIALGDWRADPAVRAQPTLLGEVAEMQAEVARCKEILAGILRASGEVTGDAPRRTTIGRFVASIVATAAAPERIVVEQRVAGDPAIVADRALGQALLNLLDNAVEAGAAHVALAVERDGDDLVIRVVDDGPGFPRDMLAGIGRPYRTTKARRGAGLGLFLASNVLRTLGGTLVAANRERGAQVVLRLPLDALALPA